MLSVGNMNKIIARRLLMTISIAAPLGVWAQTTEERPSESDIAAELSNPNTTLGSFSFFTDYTAYKGDLDGADDASKTTLSLQPSLPYPLTDTANLLVRPLIPVILNQEVPSTDGFESFGVDLGDIGFDIAVFNSWSNGFVFGGGLAGTLPTATEDELGLNQWLLGPEVIAAYKQPWGVVGLLVSHQWDVAGEDDFDTERTSGQYFYSLQLKDGWQVGAGPTFSYDHEADSGDRWTLPIAIGVSKVTFMGKMPVRLGIQYWHYVKQADPFGPAFQIRLQVTPVIPLPW